MFIGRNYGARNWERIRKCYGIILFTVMGLGEGLGVLMYCAPPTLIRLFTRNPLIAAFTRTRMFYTCLFYALRSGMNVISGCICGLRDTTGPLILSIICSVMVRLGWTLLIAEPSGNICLIYAGYPIC